ncbi:MAG: PAS domain S-box protein [Bacteroidetes bacterium]|nr:PAS domain S-box protein [Bacteroidota bacterium]
MPQYYISIYTLLYALTVVISLMAAFVAFQHRNVSGGLTLAILMLLTAWWCLGGLFETSSIAPPAKFFWSKIEYLGGVNVPVLFFLLTIQYTRPAIKLRLSWIILLFIVPVFTLFAAFTNDLHHLIWTGFAFGPAGSNQIIYHHGIWFWIGFTGYSYLMLLASMIILINSLVQYRHTFRYQLIALGIAALLPWTGSILYLLDINPLPGLDLTRIAFSGSGIVLVFAISKFRFLDLLPRARVLLLETMQDGILVFDVEKRIIDINPSARSILGIGMDEYITGKRTNEINSDHLQLIHTAIEKNSESKIYAFPPRYIEVSPTSLYNKKGEISGYCLTMHDITALKQKENALLQSEEKYKAIAENISDVIWMLDMSLKYTYVSPSIEAQRGFTVREFMNLSAEEIYPEESLKIVLSKFREYRKLSEKGRIHKNTRLILEVQHKCKDGSIKTGEVHANAILDENNRLIAIHGITRDITERKLEESALKQRDRLLQSVTRAVISLLHRADLEIAIQEALQILGEAINADRVYIFENIRDDKNPDMGMRLRHQWINNGSFGMRAGSDADIISYQTSFPRWYERLSAGKSVNGLVSDFPDLERMVLEPQFIKSLLVIPISIESNFWGFIGFDDCTNERVWSQAEESILTTAAISIGMAYVKKRNEIELIKAKEHAEESDRLKSAFLATMSHELRTPLNAIIGFSGIIGQDMDSAEQEEYIRIINKSGKNLLNIIEDLFNISMIESGDIRVEMEHFSFEKFRSQLNEILYTEIKSMDKPGLAVHYSPDPGHQDLYLFTDPAKLLQIFSNILKNSVKFTKEGSIEYGYTLGNGKEVIFFVKDTGIGIEPELQRVIFEKFRQADESYTRRFGGTGLGLSISKRLAELLHGNIWVESEPGKGSAFFFMVPCRDLSWHTSRGNSPDTQALEFLHNKTILLVEDEESNFLLIKTILKHSEATLLWAKNGQEGIEMIDSHEEISVVLMDIKMPVMDGYEATRVSKTLRPKLPVIAMTAHALYGDEEKAFESGFDNYIPKPISKTLLFTILEQYLS